MLRASSCGTAICVPHVADRQLFLINAGVQANYHAARCIRRE
jgi:hypothetical protein